MLNLCLISCVTIVAVLGLVACKSPEQRIIEWYENARANEAGVLPAAAECARYTNGYWDTVRQQKLLTDQYMRQEIEVAEMRMRLGPTFDRQAETLRRSYNQAYMQAQDALWESLGRRTGWGEDGTYYCSARFTRQRDPSGCQNLHVPSSGPEDWFGPSYYGNVEYCIENRIPPFD